VSRNFHRRILDAAMSTMYIRTVVNLVHHYSHLLDILCLRQNCSVLPCVSFNMVQRQTAVAWDVIIFNFGLHNLVNTETAKDEYRSELLEISLRLSLLMPHAKLFVEDLNDIAKDILQKHFVASIDIVDLYKVVTSHW
jgi:hypothetical protein